MITVSVSAANPMPEEVVLKLKAVATIPQKERIQTIDDIVSWARMKYPRSFVTLSKPLEIN